MRQKLQEFLLNQKLNVAAPAAILLLLPEVFGENSFYREIWGTRLGSRYVAKRSSDPARRPAPPPLPAAVRHWRTRQSSGTGPCGDCRRVLLVLGPRGPYSGKIRFSRHLSYKTRGGGGRHVAKRSSDHQQRYATGEVVKVQGRDRVGIVIGYCGTGPEESVFGENSFF